MYPVRFCRIGRMEEVKAHMAGKEPEGTAILRYIRGTASEEETVRMESWMQETDENEKTVQQFARIYHASTTQERILARDPEAAYSKVQNQIRQRIRKTRLSRVYMAAACFIGVLIMSSVISYWKPAVTVPTTQLITVQANAGMRTHLSLPDGTVAYLNSGSTLSYPLPYDKKERKVMLSGEAYFKVAHNEEQPFIVSVMNDKMRVKVLGTEFNLQAYETENNIETTLISGSVFLEARKNNKIVQSAKLIPSEKAIYDWVSGAISIETVNTEYEIAWKEGRLMFKNQPLPQVLKELSLFYNVKFEVRDSVINSYYFTGTFENKQLTQVLDYLKISSLIDYTIKQAESDDSSSVQYTTVILSNF